MFWIKNFLILVVLILIVAGILVLWNNSKNVPLPPQNMLTLTSDAFKNNELIPFRFTCDGENVNPPLGIQNVPPETKSLALVVDDPDAPSGNWVHWIVWNIDPNLSEIKENSVPQGSVEGTTSFDKPGYGGPCPPSGTHHYQFKLYALETKLEIGKENEKAQLESAMKGHIIEETKLVGLYKRETGRF